MFENIPWLAIIVATVANMVMGFLWFGPLFGKQWAEASGVDMDNADASPSMYAVPALGALLAAIVLWNMMSSMGVSTLGAAVGVAFWAWLGFVAFTSLTNAMFRGSSTRLWTLESFAHLVGFELTAVILVLMALPEA